MSVNETYQSTNCDDHDNLEPTCQYHLLSTLALKDDKILQTKANDLVSRKNVEYPVADVAGETRELHLDRITSFNHPQVGTVVVGES